jgi:hypothetical protein
MSSTAGADTESADSTWCDRLPLPARCYLRLFSLAGAVTDCPDTDRQRAKPPAGDFPEARLARCQWQTARHLSLEPEAESRPTRKEVSSGTRSSDRLNFPLRRRLLIVTHFHRISSRKISFDSASAL